MPLQVLPVYGAIGLIQDLCEPWINLLGGDEWGESMRALHRACTVDYGFSDEDCALFAGKLFDYLQYMKTSDWIDVDGPSYGCFTADDVAKTQAECCRIRQDWLRQQWTREAAQHTLKDIPGWVFGESTKGSSDGS